MLKKVNCSDCNGRGFVSQITECSITAKTCSVCDGFGFVEVPMTNADRIREMSDEELAWKLMTWRLETEAKHNGIESNYPNTQVTILEWLKQPAEGE